MWIVNISASRSEYPDTPYQRPMEIGIVINGDSTSDVMHSPRLLTTITQTIMDGCLGVGSVSYVAAESDWVEMYGWVGNQVIQFECVDPGREIYYWGTYACL